MFDDDLRWLRHDACFCGLGWFHVSTRVSITYMESRLVCCVCVSSVVWVALCRGVGLRDGWMDGLDGLGFFCSLSREKRGQDQGREEGSLFRGKEKMQVSAVRRFDDAVA